MIHNIQALRALAALWVVLYHALPHFRDMGLRLGWFESLCANGYAGVDVFFLISGFVMARSTHALPRGVQSAGRFLALRAGRIYLGFWPFFLLAALMYAVYEPEAFARMTLWRSFFLFNPDMHALMIGPSWSLVYELYFYALVTLALIHPALRALGLWVLMLVLMALKVFFLGVQAGPALDFFLSPLLLEFFAGYMLFHLIDRARAVHWLVVFVAVSAYGLFRAMHLDFSRPFDRVLSWGLCAWGVLAAAVWLEQRGWLRIRGVLKALGDSSYTLYLLHPILLGLFWYTGLRTALMRSGWGWLGYIGFMVLIVAVAHGLYLLLERPLYRWYKRRVLRAGAQPPAA